jgi:hypothetical protein
MPGQSQNMQKTDDEKLTLFLCVKRVMKNESTWVRIEKECEDTWKYES